MRQIKISYNPYCMKTEVSIDGDDVRHSNRYPKLQTLIEEETPLQVWINPIPYRNWRGFVEETEGATSDEVSIEFSGRQIDFEDFKRSIESQNNSRTEKTRISYHFIFHNTVDDIKLLGNIDEVVHELLTDRFKDLIRERSEGTAEGNTTLVEIYDKLKETYEYAKKKEFCIVFTGPYSSGKSTLLNVLMRHNILPVGNDATTHKVCLIKHDPKIGRKIRIRCLDKDGKDYKKIPVKEFQDDTDAANEYLNICPITDENIYPEVDAIELCVDLSHLYPEANREKMEESFTIELLDTPGLDAAEAVEENGVNLDEEIASNAILSKDMSMVVLVVNGISYQLKCIGSLMAKVAKGLAEEGNVKHSIFNNRFLFVMNRSDDIVVNNDKGLLGDKENYSNYLTHPEKWEGVVNPKNIPGFVPRIFMTASGVALAIQEDIPRISSDGQNIQNDVSLSALQQIYERFEIDVTKKRRNRFLSPCCDIPQYQLDEIKRKSDKAYETDEYDKVAGLQCGVYPLELAIRDFVERYAFPVKMRKLVDSFNPILKDVTTFNNAKRKELEKARNYLEETGRNLDIELVKKESDEEKEARKRSQDEKIKHFFQKINEVKFDFDNVDRLIGELRKGTEADPMIKELRSRKKISVPAHQSVRNEIKRYEDHIEELLRKNQGRIAEEVEKSVDKYQYRIKVILDKVKRTVDEEFGEHLYGEFDFKNDAAYKALTEEFDIDKFIDIDAVGTEQGEKGGCQDIIVPNPRYKEFKNSRNIFKKIAAIFIPKWIKDVERIPDKAGYFETAELKRAIDEYYNELEKNRGYLEDMSESICKGYAEKLKCILENLQGELERFRAEIEEVQKKIENLENDRDKFNEAITSLSETCTWLDSISKKIEGVRG